MALNLETEKNQWWRVIFLLGAQFSWSLKHYSKWTPPLFFTVHLLSRCHMGCRSDWRCKDLIPWVSTLGISGQLFQWNPAYRASCRKTVHERFFPTCKTLPTAIMNRNAQQDSTSHTSAINPLQDPHFNILWRSPFQGDTLQSFFWKHIFLYFGNVMLLFNLFPYPELLSATIHPPQHAFAASYISPSLSLHLHMLALCGFIPLYPMMGILLFLKRYRWGCIFRLN